MLQARPIQCLYAGVTDSNGAFWYNAHNQFVARANAWFAEVEGAVFGPRRFLWTLS